MRTAVYPGTPRQGFTLVELLVAMAVTLLLLVIFLQIVNLTSRTTHISDQAVDAAAQARVAFDRIGLDFSGLVKDYNADFQVANPSTNPPNILTFLSGVVAAGLTDNSGNRNLSLVSYCVNASADNANRPCLLRAGKPIVWNDLSSGPISKGFLGWQKNGLPQPFPSSMLPDASKGDFDVLASGVIRMVAGFQLYPDNQPARLKDGTTEPLAVGQIVYSPPIQTLTSTDGSQTLDVIDLSRVSAVIVGLVAIDLMNLKNLSPAQVSTLAGKFSLPAPFDLPLKTWGVIAADPTLQDSSVPLPARQAVRVFQRFYPVTPFLQKNFDSR